MEKSRIVIEKQQAIKQMEKLKECKVTITRRIPQPGIDLLFQHGVQVSINPEDRPLTKQELLSAVEGCDGVLCLLNDVIDETVFKAAQQARIFANYAVGFDNIDVKAATRRGIMVTNTPGVLTDAAADLTWALLFAAARRIAQSDQYTRAGCFQGWSPMLFLGNEITGRTLGIVGAGRIGQAVAERSIGFRMKILYHSRRSNQKLEGTFHAERVDLDTLLKGSDFISLHVPLLPETIHLIGRRELGLMKKSACLINTSRGPVIDEKALVEALKNGQIAGAGLDVYEHEPDLEPGLNKLNNVILAPHIGSATVETRTKMALIAAENLIAGLSGNLPPNLLNPEVLQNKTRKT